ncbi:MAG: LysM peptidoglycan-binding domain-containing protein [Betaproteobacteria bacterium]|nr:LysM peptidoglycan-binding domain-containing protein [Betaproteobacteria bacterium]
MIKFKISVCFFIVYYITIRTNVRLKIVIVWFYIFYMKLKIFIFVFAYVISFMSIHFAKKPVDTSYDTQFVEYKVQSGDTIWEIGKKMNVENFEKFIFDVKKLNNLKNSDLIINAVLILPLNA